MNRSRILSNALFLYVRMLAVMVISIFTTRVVLHTLGVSDYGLFYTVAGVVSLLSFVTSAMSGATSRFIAFEIGKGDKANVQSVFTSSWSIHCILALIFALLVETVGVWFLNTHLIIPVGREVAANVLLQITIVISVFSILQVPFTASVMANERMNVFALIEVSAVLLKLLILYLIPLLPFDQLIVYGVLLLFITILIFSLYVIYCNVSLRNCRMRFSLKNNKVGDIFLFSTCDLYGNLSVAARTQGVIMVLELFFGVVMVAAASIAMNVQNAIMSFAGNVLSAFRPQIVKSYAAGEYDMVDRLLRNAGVYTSLLLMVVTVPLLIEMDFILWKWLGDTPPYTAIFCRLTLIFNVFANFSSVVISAIHANGNIMRPSFINGTLYLSVIPVSIIMFRNGVSPQYVYVYNIVAVAMGMMSNIWSLHLLMPTFRMGSFIFQVLVKCLAVAIFSFCATYLCSFYMEASWLRLVVTTLISTLIIAMLALCFVLDKEDVEAIRKKISSYVG